LKDALVKIGKRNCRDEQEEWHDVKEYEDVEIQIEDELKLLNLQINER
jgi:hypothetical protein